jgi:UDP-N-acetylglucosamine--N-acetylmuramyl-(pentapeptide) pyrophosphoryl-undecaprenol N-acetylglucosamine transferase
MSRSILIMAGGTGGHIFPALAVADVLRGEGWQVTWLGAPNSMEADLAPKHGYRMETVRFSGLRGKGILRKLLLPLNLAVALWQSLIAMMRVRPDLVLGMGGYITFPGGLMAAALRIPLVIHEQNSIAGLSNKVLAHVANRVLTGFPDVLPGALWCGNPVRGQIVNIDPPELRYAKRTGRLNLLVVGGSLGAKAINDAVPEALALLKNTERPNGLARFPHPNPLPEGEGTNESLRERSFNVVHQTGRAHHTAVVALYNQLGIQADIQPFIENMAASYAAADLVICRSGALTVAELAAAGVAGLLIPFPFAVDDHQTHNARFLSERGAAILLPQSELNADRLAQLLRELVREKLMAMAQQARNAAKSHAADTVAGICAEIVEKGEA